MYQLFYEFEKCGRYIIVSCKLNYIDSDMSPNNQNYCGVSYF